MKTSACTTALEVADESRWFKSSYSTDNGGGGCVSIAALPGGVGIRDSKHKNGPALVTPASAWASFIAEVQAGRLG
ncbi:DUF397 domain-containing protein [Streptomyces sp. NPDC053079]|uniref:DUF397 domain-containing protein n=1 Tax=Streptomyces sp. NPDC053079 TaxID=3365697 RepID=UPI0037D90790